MTSYDRKIRPIYDALDARNPKQAIKLCDAALKKASIPLVSALKAVALERSGKADEATTLARTTAAAATRAAPIDETVLSTLMIVFKSLGLADEGSAAYEAGFQVEPGNGELALHLFSAHLRMAAWAKAQQLAMKLFKRPQGDEYVFWAVTCLILQVDEMGPPCQPSRHYADGAVPETAAKHLQLAAAMMSRAAAQGKLRKASHLRLLLEVYRRQRARAEALEALEAHGALLGSNVDSVRLKAELLEGMGRHAEAQALHATLLTEYTPDDFDAHRAQIRCAFAADADAGGDGPALARARAVIESLQAAKPGLRGPHLAALVLGLHAVAPAAAAAVLASEAHRRPDAGVATAVVGSGGAAADGAGALSAPTAALVALLHAYFERYGEKTIAALDASAALAALVPSAAAQRALLDPMKASLSVASHSPPELSALRRAISHAQWTLQCGATGSMPLAERCACRASDPAGT